MTKSSLTSKPSRMKKARIMNLRTLKQVTKALPKKKRRKGSLKSYPSPLAQAPAKVALPLRRPVALK